MQRIADIADVSELAFLYKASQKGLFLSRPYCSRTYDFLVDNDSTISKVQVKHSRNNRYSYEVRVCKRKGKKYVPYEKGDVDVFAIHLPIEDVFYLIPYDQVKGKITICVRPTSGECTYIKYRESWDIFFK